MNRDFLVNVLRDESFLAGDTTTDFIERIAPARVREASVDDLRFAAVAAALAGQFERRAGAPVLATLLSGWRNNPGAFQAAVFRIAGAELRVEYRTMAGDSYAVRVDGIEMQCRAAMAAPGRISLELDGLRREVALHPDGQRWHTHDGRVALTAEELPRFPQPQSAAAGGGYEAPMPGKVVSVHVAVGDAVEEGQLLLVIEAMKMEHHITCAKAGTVTELGAAPGQQVDGGARLIVIA